MSATPATPIKAACQCGHVWFEVSGEPIVHAKCYCNSCRTAGLGFAQTYRAPSVVEADGGSRLVLYRKDRVGFISGGDCLREHRLTPGSSTRRMVAECCGSPMFLEFTKGHWLSVYADRLGKLAPPLNMRVMVADRLDKSPLPDDVPNYPTHSPKFMLKLLGAWAAMGFRKPRPAW